MATVEINHTIQVDLNGMATFKQCCIDYDDMFCYMGAEFEDKHYPCKADALALYNELTAAEKAAALKWEKMKAVKCFNDALGTSFTWDQVPNSIFEREE